MILKNGKRLDGCSDTVPIGTVNPYLGSVAPFGYLLLQGQYVSKSLYPELYAICGHTFGPETDTEFKLPDLRGQTIAGYKEGDSTFGTLGGLIGALTVTTQNHYLTINEIPSHRHGLIQTYNVPSGSGPGGIALSDFSGTTPSGLTGPAGSDAPHNHGDVSTIQPTITLNWIVKAIMLIPNQSTVVNATNESTTNVYSTTFINNLVRQVKQETLNSAFPIGKVEVFYDDADHSNYLGFTWVRELEGLSPVGYKASDSDYSTIGNTLGSKTHSTTYTPAGTNTDGAVQSHTLTISEIPSHSHGISAVSNNHLFSGKSTWDTGADNRTYKQSSITYGSAPVHNGTSLLTAYEYSGTNGGYWVSDTGGGQGHSHDFTQPTFTGTQATISMDTRDPQKVVAYWRRVA